MLYLSKYKGSSIYNLVTENHCFIDSIDMSTTLRDLDEVGYFV